MVGELCMDAVSIALIVRISLPLPLWLVSSHGYKVVHRTSLATFHFGDSGKLVHFATEKMNWLFAPNELAYSCRRLLSH